MWQKLFVLLVVLVALALACAGITEAGGGDEGGLSGYTVMTVTGVKPDVVTCLPVVKRCSAAFTISPQGTGMTYIGYASGWGLSASKTYTLSGRFWSDGRVTRLRIVN